MAGVALAFAVLEVSDSATALGTVLAAHSIPMVAFLLAGGVIADRFGRTLVIQVSNVASGSAQLAIAAPGHHRHRPSLAAGRALAAVNGIVSGDQLPGAGQRAAPAGAARPAQAGQRPDRVPENALIVIGPAVGGILVVTIGAGWALASTA